MSEHELLPCLFCGSDNGPTLGVASLLDDGLHAVRLGEGGAWEGFGRVAGIALSGLLAYLAITGGLS